jgi:hypothetical protein
MEMMTMNDIFVFDGYEVKKTGRIAKRSVARPKGDPMVLVLIEVTPTDGTGWLKWVKPEELYVIEIDSYVYGDN